MEILDKLTGREKAILYIVIAIAALALAYNFLIEPIYKKWVEVNQEIKLLEVKLQKAISIVKEREKIEKDYVIYAEKLKPKGSDEQEMTFMLNELETLARNSGLKIINVRPKQAQDKESYKKFSVGLETESDMSALMKFIYEVKNSQQMLKIDRLTLNTKSSQSGVLIMATMSISRVAIK